MSKRALFHEDFDLLHICNQLGLNEPDIRVFVNNNEFKNPRNTHFNILGINENCLIRFEILNFKSIVYLQSADGYWNE
jgi:hypothetical protein